MHTNENVTIVAENRDPWMDFMNVRKGGRQQLPVTQRNHESKAV